MLATPVFARPRPHPVLLIAITVVGTLGMHVFVPALPAAARDLGVLPGTIQMTITLYVIGLAIGQLFYGPLSDRFGRRPVLLIGLTLYTVASVLAAFASSAGALIAARIFQALGGCAGLVLGRAMVRDGTTPERAVQQLALMNAVIAIAPAMAPAIGGLLTAWLGWRAIFAMMELIGALTLTLTLLTVPETNRRRTTGQGIRAALAGYWRLLRLRTFRAYVVGGACTTTSIYAFLSASPFLFVDVLHRRPAEIGFYYILLIGGASAGSILASRLAGRISMRSALAIACTISLGSASLLMLADLAGMLSVATMVGPMVLFAVGTGLVSPNAVSGAISADPKAIGAASGLYGFVQMSFAALCTGIVGFWHTGTAFPVATVLVVSTLVGMVSFSFTGKVA